MKQTRQGSRVSRWSIAAGLLGVALLGLSSAASAEPPRAICAPGDAACQAPAPQNVICNDGTESPTCEVCRRGCCSHHGGCR
ncbi:MAG: hypothetical protein AB7K71_38670 [Polyangiaceae bacterium]